METSKKDHKLENIKPVIFLIPAGLVILLTVIFTIFLLADEAVYSAVEKWQSIALFFYNVGTPVATFSALMAAYISFQKYIIENKNKIEKEEKESIFLAFKERLNFANGELDTFKKAIDNKIKVISDFNDISTQTACHAVDISYDALLDLHNNLDILTKDEIRDANLPDHLAFSLASIRSRAKSSRRHIYLENIRLINRLLNYELPEEQLVKANEMISLIISEYPKIEIARKK